MATRCELYYGAPGSAKSTAVAHVMKKLYNETGKKSRVLIGDGSLATYMDMGLVEAGVVEGLDVTIRDWPIATMVQLAEGYWPAEPLDPKSKLIAPTPELLKPYAVLAIEGLSVAGVYIMGDKKGGLAYRAGQGERIGGESEIRIIEAELDAAGRAKKDTGPGNAYGGHTISHFNVGQLRLANTIDRSKMWPGWVIWTGHERVSENKLTGEKIIGPEGVGNAATPSFPRVFGNTLHFATAEKVGKEVDAHTQAQISVIDSVYRIHTRNHFRAEGKTYTKYLATTRIAYPDMMPAYLESEVPGESILKFYDLIEQSKLKAKAELKAA
jgi:hypothetical protein